MSNFIFTAFITHRKMVQFFILLSSLVAFLEVITTMSQLEPPLRVNQYLSQPYMGFHQHLLNIATLISKS